MQLDTRLARLLHVLIHMHLKGGSTTSETIAQMLHTNPALVRRTMASLREARYVESGRGPGGGWTLSCDLSEVTVKDIYVALAYKGSFAWGPAEDNPQCPVESVVNEYLENALGSAENALLTIIGNTKLSHLVQKIVVPDTKASSLAASKKQAK